MNRGSAPRTGRPPFKFVEEPGLLVDRFDVTDQVGDAKLQLNVFVEPHKLAVIREAVATDRPLELSPQRLNQNSTAAARRDLEYREEPIFSTCLTAIPRKQT